MSHFEIDTPKMEARGKAVVLLNEYDAEMIAPMPPSQIPPDKALIGIKEDFFFEAAVFLHDDNAYARFTDPRDTRPRTWLLMDRAWVIKATGYEEDGGSI